jgi:hypothetical protein
MGSAENRSNSSQGAHPLPFRDEDGSINADNLKARVGLRVGDAMTIVRFGKYEGPLIDALDASTSDDPNAKTCPLADTLEEAFIEGGIDRVDRVFMGLGIVDEKFTYRVPEETKAMHKVAELDDEGKKKLPPPTQRQVFPSL